MDLTLREIEQLKGISRCQISRYAKDGRLQRTRQGHYSAASLANLAPPFDRYAYRGNFIEEKAVWLVRAEYSFRREMQAVIEKRKRANAQGYVQSPITPAELQEIDTAVKGYVGILSAMPDR